MRPHPQTPTALGRHLGLDLAVAEQVARYDLSTATLQWDGDEGYIQGYLVAQPDDGLFEATVRYDDRAARYSIGAPSPVRTFQVYPPRRRAAAWHKKLYAPPPGCHRVIGLHFGNAPEDMLLFPVTNGDNVADVVARVIHELTALKVLNTAVVVRTLPKQE